MLAGQFSCAAAACVNETNKEDFVHMYMIKFLWKPLGPPGGVEELPLGASSDCMSAYDFHKLIST